MKKGKIAIRRQRKLGAYYTPLELAEALTTWAVRDADDTLLDPSFGGCAFFAAGVRRLEKLGSVNPFRQLAGFDLDTESLTYVATLPGYSPDYPRIHAGTDFLRARPQQDSEGFSAIVGNPPYVRHHRLTASQVAIAQRATMEAGFDVPRTASYWPYFVLHSLAFLRQGGRLAMVLPFAFVHAKYAVAVHEVLESRFAVLTVIYLRERIFPDAQEGSVIVLADGWCRPKLRSKSASAQNMAQVRAICSKSRRLKQPRRKMPALLQRHSKPLDVLQELCSHKDVCELGTLATIRIGTVTGDNAFFILSPENARSWGLSRRYFKPILTSASQFKWLSVEEKDVLELLERDTEECLLLIPPRKSLSSDLNRYLESRDGQRAAKRYKSVIRDPWYRITDIAAPDAFLTYVNGPVPKLLLNGAGLLCTNAIHRLTWTRPMLTHARKLLALSFASSLSGLSAELLGRSYGGGALKLEPSEAAKLVVALPELPPAAVNIAFAFAGASAARGKWDDVRAAADELVLVKGLGITSGAIRRLRRTLHNALSLRRGFKAYVGVNAIPETECRTVIS
jgi:hypothetical protein